MRIHVAGPEIDVDFPDGMSQADMASAIQKNLPHLYAQAGKLPPVTSQGTKTVSGALASPVANPFGQSTPQAPPMSTAVRPSDFGNADFAPTTPQPARPVQKPVMRPVPNTGSANFSPVAGAPPGYFNPIPTIPMNQPQPNANPAALQAFMTNGTAPKQTIPSRPQVPESLYKPGSIFPNFHPTGPTAPASKSVIDTVGDFLNKKVPSQPQTIGEVPSAAMNMVAAAIVNAGGAGAEATDLYNTDRTAWEKLGFLDQLGFDKAKFKKAAQDWVDVNNKLTSHARYPLLSPNATPQDIKSEQAMLQKQRDALGGFADSATGMVNDKNNAALMLALGPLGNMGRAGQLASKFLGYAFTANMAKNTSDEFQQYLKTGDTTYLGRAGFSGLMALPGVLHAGKDIGGKVSDLIQRPEVPTFPQDLTDVNRGDVVPATDGQTYQVMTQNKTHVGVRQVDADGKPVNKAVVKVPRVQPVPEPLPTVPVQAQETSPQAANVQAAAEVPPVPNTPTEPQGEQVNAISQQGAGQGVLRPEQPGMGLQEMGQGNVQPQGTPAEGGQVPVSEASVVSPETQVPTTEPQSQEVVPSVPTPEATTSAPTETPATALPAAVPPQEPSTPTPEVPTAPETLTAGGKNAITEQERQQLGLPDVEMQPFTKTEEGLAQGKDLYDKRGAAYVSDLVQAVKNKPRTLNPEENGAIVQYKLDVMKVAAETRKDLDAAIDAKDPQRIAELQDLYNKQRQAIDDAGAALKMSGREWAAAGHARQGEVAYDLDETPAVLKEQILAEMRRVKGADPTGADEKRLDPLIEQNRILTEKLAAAEAAQKTKPPRTVQNKAAQPLTNDFGSKNTVFTQERGQAAMQRIQEAIAAGKQGGKAMSGIDPTRGILDRIDVSDLVDAGGYLLEGGVRKFGEWADRMRQAVPDITDALLQHVWGQVKAEAQQNQATAQSVPQPSNFVEELAKKINWTNTAAFLDAIKDEDGTPAILNKLINGEELTPAEKTIVASAFNENQTVRTPGAKTPLTDAMNTVLTVAKDARQTSAPDRIQRIQDKIDSIREQLRTGQLSPVQPRTPGEKTPQQQELADLQAQLKKERAQQEKDAKQPRPTTQSQQNRMSGETEGNLGGRTGVPDEQMPRLEVARKQRAQAKQIQQLSDQIAQLQDALKPGNEAKIQDIAERQEASANLRRIQQASVPDEVQKLQQQRDYNNARIQAQIEAMQPKSALQKFVETSRQFKLSGLSVFAKLGGASLWAPPVEALGDMFSVGAGKLPAGGGKSLAQVAAREGQFRPSAELRGVQKMFSKEALQNARDTIKNGFNSLDVLAGKDLQAHSDNLLGYVGRTHGAIKSFLQTGQFYKALELRIQRAAEQGADITDPEVVAKIGMGAALDAQNVKLQGENALSNAINKAVGQFQNSPNAAVQTLGEAFSTLVPIVKVPANYLSKAFDMTGAGVVRGAITQGLEMRKAAKTDVPMTPETADNIIRAYKYGGIGLVAAYLGLAQPSWLQTSGFYSKDADYGKNAKGEDREASEIAIGGHTVPKLFAHNPLIEAIQFWATVRRGFEQSANDDTLGKFRSGLYQAGRGLAEEVPGAESTVMLGRALQGENAAAKAAGEYAKGLTNPQLLQQSAKYFDRDKEGKPVKREQKGFTDTFLEGIPGVRNTLPEAGGKTLHPSKAATTPEAIDRQQKRDLKKATTPPMPKGYK